MRTQIEKVFNLTNFLKIKQSSTNYIISSLEIPSLIILQNIYKNWLQSIYAKTKQHYPVYLTEKITGTECNKQLYYGFINQCLPSKINEVNVECNSQNYTVKDDSELKLNIIIPQHDSMQGFIQWQRYRKYWWSSITTTPGLFSVTDLKYEDKNAYANISANFEWGQWIVEAIKVAPHNSATKSSQLSCTMSLEKALITLLIDAVTNTKEDYLRLHNKMAPYKISFALKYEDKNQYLTLQDLAKQIFYKLQSSKISTWLPEFSLSFESQIKENLQLGVTYTAILSENTLSNGIFHLMNSSTMLKEQVHLADFVNYAALLCGKSSKPI